MVAPRAGAWIETHYDCSLWPHGKVAPRAGAWIETKPRLKPRPQRRVAPRAGAWIETDHGLGAPTPSDPACRRSPRGSVDRNWPGDLVQPGSGTDVPSLPARERGSKLVRERGSKLVAFELVVKPPSLPARGRGSKLELDGEAFLAGSTSARGRGCRRRSPRGGVDRNFGGTPRRVTTCVRYRERRSPRGGVDRNSLTAVTGPGVCRAWRSTRRRSPRGGVDRNRVLPRRRSRRSPAVAPRAGAWIETRRTCRATACRACRSPRGGVDRNSAVPITRFPAPCRSPRGGVDRNRDRNACRPKTRGSLPARGRGSKHAPGCALRSGRGSLPARGRGSKLLLALDPLALDGRSPRGGVDRNSQVQGLRTPGISSLPARGRGSKLESTVRRGELGRSRRSPRGGVDRNFSVQSPQPLSVNVAPRAGAWIETLRICDGRDAPRAGASHAMTLEVAPRAGAWIETRRAAPWGQRWRSLPARGRGSKHWGSNGEDVWDGRSPRGGVDRNSRVEAWAAG